MTNKNLTLKNLTQNKTFTSLSITLKLAETKIKFLNNKINNKKNIAQKTTLEKYKRASNSLGWRGNIFGWHARREC